MDKALEELERYLVSAVVHDLSDNTIKTAIQVIKELKEYKDLGLTVENIKEIDRLYSEQAKELMEYRKAEKDGLLLRLPCKVGDEVYFILIDGIDKHKHLNYIISYPHEITEVYPKGFLTNNTSQLNAGFTNWEEVGKTVFFTKSDAEAKLKELEGE